MAMYLRVWSPSAYANGADCVSFGTGSAALFTALRHVKWSIPTSFGLANEVDAFFNHFLTNLKKGGRNYYHSPALRDIHKL